MEDFEFDFDPDEFLTEYQTADDNITHDEVIQRIIDAGGEARIVDGDKRIYVYRIAWNIMGYDPDTRFLIDRTLTEPEAQELMTATMSIYFDTKTDTFVCPSPAGKTAVELVDDTLKISADLDYIKNNS